MWRRPDGRALIATADFFTPIVDDPRVWGRIAAVNAASDVWAMGGSPMFALALAAWPRDVLSLDLLGEVLAGGQAAATDGGWIVAGGHTVDAPEPMYGQAVVGDLPDGVAPLTNAGAQPGQVVVLTKPLGTGIVATMVKRQPPEAVAAGGRWHDLYALAVGEMTRTNRLAAVRAREAAATAATDVTGFGLLGHLGKLAVASGAVIEVDVGRVPVMPGVADLIADGVVPGGTMRNLEHARGLLGEHDIKQDVLVLLADAQTSGGLVFTAPAEAAESAVARLRADGHEAALIGRVVAAGQGRLDLR